MTNDELVAKIAETIDRHKFSTVSKRHPWAIRDGTGDCGCGSLGACDWQGKYLDHSTHLAEAILKVVGDPKGI
jgi:hypothetical protein